MGIQQLLADEGVVRLVGKVGKGLVHDQADPLFLRPPDQAADIPGRDIVSGGVIRVDEHQVVNGLAAKEGHQVVGGIPEVRPRRGKADVGPVLTAVGILLKCGADEAGDALQPGHQSLDQLRRAVAHHDIVLVDGKIPACQQGIYPHAGGILGQQRGKVGLQLVDQPLGREVGIHQIAEVQQLGITPVAAVASLHQADLEVRVLGKHGRGDIQILDVVDLVPELAVQALGPDLGVIQHGDDPQDLLIIFVVAQGLGVRLQEGDVVGLGKVAAELIDIDGLIVLAGLLELEALPRNEGLDAVICPQLHAGAVHPALVLVHQSQRLPGVVQQLVDDGVLKDQIRLKQQGIILAEVVLGQGQRIDVVGLVVNGVMDIDNRRPDAQGVDVLHELLALIAHHDDDAGQMAALDLMEHPVDQGHAVDLYHALGPVLGQLLQAFAHARCQYDCLHMVSPFLSGVFDALLYPTQRKCAMADRRKMRNSGSGPLHSSRQHDMIEKKEGS